MQRWRAASAGRCSACRSASRKRSTSAACRRPGAIPGTERLHRSRRRGAVARLKAAGAVVLGKTNVPTMLADWQTLNPIYGVTNNPWRLDRTPGGSSGGSAAALAAGYVSLELGSDLGGSLRVPAHCCGVFAHKPTYGLVPQRGFAPPGTPVLSVGVDVDLAVIGPMARSAADLALALDVIAGPDDAQAIGYRLELPPPRHAELKDFRVLVIDHHPLLPTASVVRSALDALAGRVAAAGGKVVRDEPAAARPACGGAGLDSSACGVQRRRHARRRLSRHAACGSGAAGRCERARLRRVARQRADAPRLDPSRPRARGAGTSVAAAVPRHRHRAVPGHADAGIRTRSPGDATAAAGDRRRGNRLYGAVTVVEPGDTERSAGDRNADRR